MRKIKQVKLQHKHPLASITYPLINRKGKIISADAGVSMVQVDA